eukprot:s4393_g2.t1
MVRILKVDVDCLPSLRDCRVSCMGRNRLPPPRVISEPDLEDHRAYIRTESCKLLAMEESLTDVKKWSISEETPRTSLTCNLRRLHEALHHLQKAGDPMDDPMYDTLAGATCRIAVRLATAFTEQVTFLVASRDVSKSSLRLLDSISRVEEEAVNLLTGFYNDRQDVASALCQIGRQKIQVLAQLAEVLTSMHEAPSQGKVRWDHRFRFHAQDLMSRIWVPVAEVAQGLAQLLSHVDLEICDEARTVLLGIRSLATLPIIAEGADAWHTSFWKDLVVGPLGQHVEGHASFPALGMRATSEDLERFKDQTRLLCNAAMTSAVSASVTVGGQCEEDKDGWLQRQEPEFRSEMDGWQQLPSAGSWTLCSSSSNWTWDVVDQSV